MENIAKPWPALWALVLGFFMILVDSTIVSVANPAIMEGLGAGIGDVLWVTSAYLLAYAVPLLVTGRLGDRFGPKNLYLAGLVVFTLASVWCGLSGDIGTLILARVFQGLGASLMTPQTMAVITRIFPPDKRGAAMGLWGAAAGVATLVGPILGGVLVDSLGWEWIFFINVPVGILAFVLAWRLVPRLSTHPHRFDVLGVVLSSVGLFLLIFGLQEGETFEWGTIAGPITVWSLIIAGIVVLVAFVVWQAVNTGEPLLPLALFRDRNFALGNAVIATVGFAITSMSLPIVFFYQIVRGLAPTQSALMLVPMAVLSGVLAAPAGKLVDRINPRLIATAGMTLFAVALFWYSTLMTPDQPLWMLLLPSALLGVANAGIWGPLASMTTRNLPPQLAGAGSGVYNTVRQVGAVFGSASIAALMQARLGAELPGDGAGSTDAFGGGALPEFLHGGFSTAMGQSLLLPAAIAIIGAVLTLFFAKPKPTAWGSPAAAVASDAAPAPRHP
ncbi:DHA2 family efflux MFS transporter permease subunit [Mycetocola sp. CAN_C7]|uniref:DHA2 family efflux MFS transporter permease subunit n=1 Tax=Mycetocola sp. CAN_C7 TaxID=2787724 RepID=UPI0018CA0845